MEFVFDHVAQVVPDISDAVAWYVEHVGASVLYQDATWAFVEAGGARLAFVVKDQHPNHLAWRVSLAELETLAAKHEKAIKTHRDGTRSFYLEAPGGTHVEIITWDTVPQ
ncbi:VOC family protein [Armatimonas rosea]|uniref:Catechol 2,3-dioxygenase-like lactoylglutathione lyase family enzyme n=1 Tax=Armatimonas rosea TaxID=685828 RepID=A0A7W9SV00_ARMRO|nr:VOC family protein [Armatimonas rosea]MBB6053345.1 catechol 2,3-dioxygenase-like lactoylglutathione lyase family enzyme [Armatimonas rosea]